MSGPATQLPDSARQVLIAVNPRAGARNGNAKVQRLADRLQNESFQVEILADCAELSRRATELLAGAALRGIVAAGGDGTVAEVINRCPEQAPLAILPLGTENLLAKYIGQDPAPDAVAQTILDGRTVILDAARAGTRIFTLMISAGVDADVIRRLHESRDGHITHWTYAKPIWESFRSYTYPQLRIYCHETDPGDPATLISARWVIGVNLPQYARGLKFAPAAVGTDGQLDVCAFGRGSLAAHLWHLLGVITGQQGRLKDCTMRQVTRLRIESDAPVPYQIDGDLGGWLPVDVEILPGRLRLLVPAAFAEKQIFIHRESKLAT